MFTTSITKTLAKYLKHKPLTKLHIILTINVNYAFHLYVHLFKQNYMKNTEGTYVTFVIPIKTPFNVDEN